MTDVDFDEPLLLSRARRGLSPTGADRERVGRSLRAALAVPPGAGAGTDRTVGRAPSGTGATSRAVGRTLGWMPRAVMIAALASATGAIGYVTGRSAGLRASRPGAAAAGALAAPPSSVPSPSPAVRVAEAGPEEARAGADEPRSSTHGGRAPHPGVARPLAPPRPPAPGEASLDAEVQALRSVERALRDRQPRLALALLRELDRTVPAGRLKEEREATSAIARCVLGEAPFGVNLAQDFTDHFPNSVYLTRVDQSCSVPAAGSGERPERARKAATD